MATSAEIILEPALGPDKDRLALALSVALYHATEARVILAQCKSAPPDLVTACHNLEADLVLAMGGLEAGDFEA